MFHLFLSALGKGLTVFPFISLSKNLQVQSGYSFGRHNPLGWTILKPKI